MALKEVRLIEDGRRALIRPEDFDPKLHEEPKAVKASDQEPPQQPEDLTIAELTSKDAGKLIAEAKTAEELDKLESDEKGNPEHEGGRKGVLKAIEARRAELAG